MTGFDKSIYDIEPGDNVVVTTADGQELGRKAVTGIEKGHDVLVVWVCSEKEWTDAIHDPLAKPGVPWPAEAVKKL